MKKLAVGILAHVDAGKTTLSEGLLYSCGCLRRLGRVDHGDAFLDTDALERERGVTIFSKQAVLPLEGVTITLLDTPGHIDFSTEMERTLQVLDCAILVINGSDGVQGHTLTLWRLLRRYHIPTFLFINKMDLPDCDRTALMNQLRAQLDGGCVDFSAAMGVTFFEEVALCGEGALAAFLDTGTVPDGEIAALLQARALFPCYFGSALRLEGVDDLLRGLERYATSPQWPVAFGARVYKIGRDPQGVRLTYLKITGGTLRVKSLLSGDGWAEKVEQIRLYSGTKFQITDQADAGTVCAVTGLTQTRTGQGLGIEDDAPPPALAPVLTYRLLLPEGCDPHTAYAKLSQLEEEDPQLHLVWDGQHREIHVQLMGQMQIEVLRNVISRRFGLETDFSVGSLVYQETIAAPALGVGHYEPLRHYAEVHLLLEPGEPGSGLTFSARCPEDVLDPTWQRLVLSQLAACSHRGVLTGAPVTDLHITLVSGRGHQKHTEGGDFRQAACRALRQGLKRAESVLLEPWYQFRLEVPAGQTGRAMADLRRLESICAPPETVEGGMALLTGAGPVSTLRDYAGEVAAYTKGLGRFSCALLGYRPCHNQEAVVGALGYDSDRDTEHPADSVFCAHGAGFTVKWDQVEQYAHVSSAITLQAGKPPEPESVSAPTARSGYTGTLEQDKELQAIFERTYGPVKRRAFQPTPHHAPAEDTAPPAAPSGPPAEEYLLVDGYNIIFAWEELREIARDNLDAARQLLMDLLSNYQGFRHCHVVLVFDAYQVPRSTGEVLRYHNIHVVYTKQAETADAYIEKTTYQIARHHRVRVATSDGVEQLIILGHGALRLSASAFRLEMQQVSGQISGLLRQNNRRDSAQPLKAALEQAEHRKH